MMRTTIKYDLASAENESQIRTLLADQHPIKKEATIIGRLAYYDTFDWRLLDKSLVLYSFQNRLFLQKLGKEKTIHNSPLNTIPSFIWDVTKGDLKRYLEPIIKVRKLIKRMDLVSRSTVYRVLDQNEKTVTKLVFETIRTRGGKNTKTIGRHLWLKPVRGYPKYSKKIKTQLERMGLPSGRDKDVFFQTLKGAGLDPRDHSSKLRFQLSPDMRADEATINILQFLRHVMKVNESQIEHEIDTEILHDFRVALRRTRSALVWDKKIFSPKLIAHFKKDLSFVGKISNDLRDLDVYLLNKPKYKALLPAVFRDDIDPLFDYLGKQRDSAFRKVLQNLNSAKYRKIMRDWDAFLDEPPQELALGPNAGLPVFGLACMTIYKQYRTIVKAGKRILENEHDEELHRLRIQCKKLRYLLQFFTNLFPPRKINPLVDQLKRLQDMLGNFNDLCIQVNYLLKVTKEMPANLSQLNKTLVAMGSLIGKLESQRKLVKESFAKIFIHFSSSQNQNLFRELFSRQSKQVSS